MTGEKRPIVVLQVIGEMVLGGAESRIMDLLRTLDTQKVHYDFLVFNLDEQHYDKEIQARGSRLYRLQPRYRIYNTFAYRRALKKFFKAHPEIDIVQGHMTSAASVYLPVAKACGVKCTIAHARSAGTDPGLRGRVVRLLLRGLYKKADVLFACSPEAAIAVYGKERYEAGQVRILPNATTLGQYRPTEEHRAAGAALRKQLGIEDRFVVGHIGRFHYAKNHEFLLEVFAEIVKQREDAVLLLVGDGERMAYVRACAARLHIEEYVIYTGEQSNPAPYYQAMELLIFPSRYEGLPGTVVEAQAAGLPVLLSDTVTDMVCATPLVRRYPLTKSAASWATAALTLQHEIRERASSDFEDQCYQALCAQGFDVTAQAKQLEELYAALLRDENA